MTAEWSDAKGFARRDALPNHRLPNSPYHTPIPANTTQVRLTGVYEVRTLEIDGFAYDTAQLALTQTDGTPFHVFKDLSNLTPTTAWTAIDQLAPANLAGQTIRIRITTTNDIIDATSFYFDTLALTATICQ